jgi:hypothetical protein
MSNDGKPTAFPSYPGLSRQIESLAHSWSTSSLDPRDWADQFWESFIADPGERRRARAALDAAIRRDLARNLKPAEGLGPDGVDALFTAVDTAATNVFLVGVWLGQLGFARFPRRRQRRSAGGALRRDEGRRRGGRGRS